MTPLQHIEAAIDHLEQALIALPDGADDESPEARLGDRVHLALNKAERALRRYENARPERPKLTVVKA